MTIHGKHLNYLNLLTLGTVLLAGCAPADEFDDAPELVEADDEDDAPVAVVADELQSNSASIPTTGFAGLEYECAERLAPIIAKVPFAFAGACSFPGLSDDWQADELFAHGSPWLEAQLVNNALPSTSPLLYYCKYEYIGDSPQDPIPAYEDFFAAFARYARGKRIDAWPATDCPSVTTLGGLDDPDILDASSDAFMDAVDAVDGTTLASLNLGTVHTYLLDTKQDGIVAFDPHADRLRTMLEDLACAGRPGCASSIHEVLVAPLRDLEDFATSHWGINEADGGGTHGYVYQTALGVVLAVQDWRELNSDGDWDTLERGVINLSMGAVDSGSYATNTAFAPAKAVLEAMQMAVCYDMQIFAAAGNRDIADANCSDPGTGLMFPASFESISLPTAVQCQNWGYDVEWNTNLFPRAVDSQFNEGRPIVQAVGAVDHEDQRLPITRMDGTVVLAAPGAQGITPTGVMPLTGTSVATLVATAGANLVWSADPQLISRDVVGLLHASGWETSMTADAGMYEGSVVRRISLCAALDDTVGGLNCSATAPAADPTAGIVAAIADTIDDAEQNQTFVSFTPSFTPDPPLCEQQPVDLLIPQPFRPHCANCNVGVDITTGSHEALYMSIAPQTWSMPMHVTTAVLLVTDSTEYTTQYALDSSIVAQINQANPDTVIEVLFDHPDPVSASLKFKYQQTNGPATASVTQQLLVY